MSGDWIAVAVTTGLLVVVTVYVLFLAFRSRGEGDHGADAIPEAGARPAPETGRKAA